MTDDFEIERRHNVLLGLLREYKSGVMSETVVAKKIERIEWPRTCVCDVCGRPFEPEAKKVRFRRYLCSDHSDQITKD